MIKLKGISLIDQTQLLHFQIQKNTEKGTYEFVINYKLHYIIRYCMRRIMHQNSCFRAITHPWSD